MKQLEHASGEPHASPLRDRANYIVDMAHQLKRMALTDGHEVAAYMLEMTVLEMRDLPSNATSRVDVCRREEMRKVRDRSSQELQAYELGGQEFNAAADCIDGCIQRLDELLSHPSIVLAERRFSLTYEARKTLAALRIELHGSSR